jgi:butyryl-CoA dehydrogenase
MKRFGFPIAEEDLMIAKVARDFAERRLAEGAAERDRTARFPIEQIQDLASSDCSR